MLSKTEMSLLAKLEVENLQLRHGNTKLRERVKELEARLRPGVSTILNDLIAADFAHINPVTGEISLTFHGQLLVDKAKELQSRSREPAN